jgi:hypothetical protein
MSHDSCDLSVPICVPVCSAESIPLIVPLVILYNGLAIILGFGNFVAVMMYLKKIILAC